MGDEIQIKERILTFKKKLGKNETYKVSQGKKFFSLHIFKKPQLLKGISSYCSDGKHVIFIDWDNVPKWLVEQDYERIQKEYNLPPGYLFTTKEEVVSDETFGSYHIICLAKFYPKQVYEILTKTHADVNFMSMPVRNKFRNWILRISDKKRKSKPSFVSILNFQKEFSDVFEISSAHLDFLYKLYEFPAIDYVNLNESDKIFLQEYEAS